MALMTIFTKPKQKEAKTEPKRKMSLMRAYWLHWTNKEFPCGMTSREAIEHLQNTTYSGKHWNVPAVFQASFPRVYIHMDGDEFVEIDLITGKRKREDFEKYY